MGREIGNIIPPWIKRFALDYFLLHQKPERATRSKAEIFRSRIMSECIIEELGQEREDEGGSGVMAAWRGTTACETQTRVPLCGRVCLDSKHRGCIKAIWKRDRSMTDSNYLLSTRLIIQCNFRSHTFQRKIYTVPCFS